jgi:hypothetical protein
VRMKGVDQRQREMVCADQISPRAVATQRKSRDVRLGVKWSQVQILSARQVFPQLKRLSELVGRIHSGMEYHSG